MTPVKSIDGETAEPNPSQRRSQRGDPVHVQDRSAVIVRPAAARAPTGVALSAVVETRDS
jgi:hypothetical protein